jgi:hypothetical protein
VKEAALAARSERPQSSQGERFQSAPVNPIFEELIVPACSDDYRQRLPKIGARRAVPAGIEDRDSQNPGHDYWLAISGEFPVLQANFPLYELTLAEGVEMSESLAKLIQFAAIELGRGNR